MFEALLRLLRKMVLSVGALWLVVSFTPLTGWWVSQLAQPWGNCQGDVLIVLGGNGLRDGILGTSSYWRAVYAVRAMRKQRFQQVVLSGRNGDGGRSIAELTQDFLEAANIDTARVRVETESESTRENALRSIPLVAAGQGKVVLLTSDFHVWRAQRVFRKAGLEVEPCPAPDLGKRSGSWKARSEVFVDLVTESAKIAWYKWQGWI